MATLSMAAAAKKYAVSRPTLAKHREKGKITGQKVGSDWQFDESELQRLYQLRNISQEVAATALDRGYHSELPGAAGGDTRDLQAEIKRLEALVESEREARALVQSHLDDLRKLLPAVVTPAPTQEKPRKPRWKLW